MENASKALIIAGAILLSILIIGLGMTIYQKASGAMDGADLTGTAVQTYNSEFEQYRGTQTGTSTRALYQLITSHNRTNQNDTSMQIACSLTTTATDSSSITEKTGSEEPEENAPTLSDLSQIKNGFNYYVYFTYSKAGYITHCYITRVK